MKPSDEMTECLNAIRTGLEPDASVLARSIAHAALSRMVVLMDGAHDAASHAPKRPRKKKAEPGVAGVGA